MGDIAGLWLLILAVGLILALVLAATVFRSESRVFLGRLANFRLKRGETELVINERVVLPEKAEKALEGPQAAAPPIEAKSLSSEEEKSGEDLEAEMFDRFNEGDFEGGEKAFNKLQEAEHNPCKKLANEAWYLWLRFLKGDIHAQEKLQNLEKRTEGCASERLLTLRLDAACYSFAENHDVAAERYQKAAALCTTDESRASNIKSASSSLIAAGKSAKARDLLRKGLGEVGTPAAQAEIYLGLADVYAAEKNYERKALMLEKALLGQPNEPTVHFEAGYAYAQAGLQMIAAFHYKKAIAIDSKNGGALNNLGVAFATLDAKKLAIDYYKRAMAQGDSLGASNLVHIFVEAGAADEARKIINEVKEWKNVDPNVNKALVKLERLEEENRDRRKTIEDVGSAYREFMLSYADAILEGAPLPEIDGGWVCTG